MEKNKNLKLSIITVNYNGFLDTCDFIRSIELSSITIPYEVIVVDNGSKRNEADLLQQQFSFITAIRSEENLGFAGGNNIGIKRSSGDYLYLLNNDTLLPENAGEEINAMIEFLETQSAIGALSPKIKYTDSENLIQFAGSTPLSRITLRNTQIGYQEKEQNLYNKPLSIPYLHGAAMLLKRKVVDEVGTIPECYFLYYEELDWSCMIRQEYELYYFPYATIFHKESSSTGIDSPLKVFYLSRNRLLFAHRNLRGWERTLSKAYLLFVAAPRNILKYLCKGKFKQAGSVIRGCFSYFGIKDKSR